MNGWLGGQKTEAGVSHGYLEGSNVISFSRKEMPGGRVVDPQGGVGKAHEEPHLQCHVRSSVCDWKTLLNVISLGVEDTEGLRVMELEQAQQWRWLTCVRRRAEITRFCLLCSQPSYTQRIGMQQQIQARRA